MQLETAVAAIVTNAVATHYGVKAEELKDTTNFQRDLNADSLDVVEIRMNIEDSIEAKYGLINFSIPDEKFDKIRTVGHLTQCIVDVLREDYIALKT